VDAIFIFEKSPKHMKKKRFSLQGERPKKSEETGPLTWAKLKNTGSKAAQKISSAQLERAAEIFSHRETLVPTRPPPYKFLPSLAQQNPLP
jgi:hypothetical protein